MENLEWNSQDFLVAKAKCSNYQEVKFLRVKEYEHTQMISSIGFYTTESGKRIEIEGDREMRDNTRFYSHECSVADIPAKYQTTTEVHNIDCLLEAIRLNKLGYNPVVLNMANRQTPGGGVATGCGAQEETIFRRTNLFRSLYQHSPKAPKYGLEKRSGQYPMDANFGGIYTPAATLFREAESNGYKLMDEPVQMAFISVAGINRPKLADKTHLTDEMAECTKNKIRTILRLAIGNGHDAAVLGALGCGAFHNPPSHVAQLFHEVINEAEFANKLALISFAIIDDHNAHRSHNPEGNLVPFERVFNNNN